MVDELHGMLTDRAVFMCSSLTSIILSEGRAVTDLGLQLGTKLITLLAGAAWAAYSTTHGHSLSSVGRREVA